MQPSRLDGQIDRCAEVGQADRVKGARHLGAAIPLMYVRVPLPFSVHGGPDLGVDVGYAGRNVRLGLEEAGFFALRGEQGRPRVVNRDGGREAGEARPFIGREETTGLVVIIVLVLVLRNGAELVVVACGCDARPYKNLGLVGVVRCVPLANRASKIALHYPPLVGIDGDRW